VLFRRDDVRVAVDVGCQPRVGPVTSGVAMRSGMIAARGGADAGFPVFCGCWAWPGWVARRMRPVNDDYAECMAVTSADSQRPTAKPEACRRSPTSLPDRSFRPQHVQEAEERMLGVPSGLHGHSESGRQQALGRAARCGRIRRAQSTSTEYSPATCWTSPAYGLR